MSRASLISIFLLTLVVTAALLASPAHAQRDAPFSTVSLSVDVSHDMHHSKFQSYWDTAPAVDIAASVPFYFGRARAAVRLMRAHSAELTDINTAFLHLGWGPSIPLSERASVDVSVSAGSLYMLFTDEVISYRKSESELAAGLRAGLSGRISGPLGAQLHVEWQHAFTSIPMDFVFVSGGLTYSVNSPDWLRSFLD